MSTITGIMTFLRLNIFMHDKLVEEHVHDNRDYDLLYVEAEVLNPLSKSMSTITGIMTFSGRRLQLSFPVEEHVHDNRDYDLSGRLVFVDEP